MKKTDIRWEPWEVELLKREYSRYGDAERLRPFLKEGRTVASIQGKVKQYGLATRRSSGMPYSIAELISLTLKEQNGCWLWTGDKRPNGYGVAIHCGKRISVHRLMFMLWNNLDSLGDGLVLHRCDVRLCINPRHLYLGSYVDNNRDTVKRGRYRNQYGPIK